MFCKFCKNLNDTNGEIRSPVRALMLLVPTGDEKYSALTKETDCLGNNTKTEEKIKNN
jgi:hypothetical protein